MFEVNISERRYVFPIGLLACILAPENCVITIDVIIAQIIWYFILVFYRHPILKYTREYRWLVYENGVKKLAP